MITDIDYVGETFTYTLSGVDTVIAFGDITASAQWTDNGIISFESDTVPVYIVQLFKESFLGEVTKRRLAGRSANEYVQAKDVYRLYRVLEGASEATADAEMDNLEDQYDALDTDKQALFTANDTAVSDWVDSKANNDAYALKAVEIANLETAMARKQAIKAELTNNIVPFDLWDYDRDNDILKWQSTYNNLLTARIEYADALGNLENVFMTYKGSAETDILQEDYQELIDARDTIVNSINTLDTEDPSYAYQRETLQQQLTLNQQYLSQKKADIFTNITDLITTNNAGNITAANELHVVFFDALTAQLVTDTADLSDLEDEYAGMPHDDELPDAPEKEALEVPVSVMMRKMIFVANDDEWEGVTLANVTPTDVDEYELENGTITFA